MTAHDFTLEICCEITNPLTIEDTAIWSEMLDDRLSGLPADVILIDNMGRPCRGDGGEHVRDRGCVSLSRRMANSCGRLVEHGGFQRLATRQFQRFVT